MLALYPDPPALDYDFTVDGNIGVLGIILGKIIGSYIYLFLIALVGKRKPSYLYDISIICLYNIYNIPMSVYDISKIYLSMIFLRYL